MLTTYLLQLLSIGKVTFHPRIFNMSTVSIAPFEMMTVPDISLSSITFNLIKPNLGNEKVKNHDFPKILKKVAFENVSPEIRL